MLIVRKQKEEDKEVYENAEKLWLDQRYEIENELKETKSKLDIFETPGCVSYDGVNYLDAILLIIFELIFLLNEITIKKMYSLFQIIKSIKLKIMYNY